ncbi:UNVERIFIED_ORG: hypothetical protein J2X79_001364 [Arthrobacter globiformis]|nr:hypothetical protein [Arthrobacter globiformis]
MGCGHHGRHMDRAAPCAWTLHGIRSALVRMLIGTLNFIDRRTRTTSEFLLRDRPGRHVRSPGNVLSLLRPHHGTRRLAAFHDVPAGRVRPCYGARVTGVSITGAAVGDVIAQVSMPTWHRDRAVLVGDASGAVTPRRPVRVAGDSRRRALGRCSRAGSVSGRYTPCPCRVRAEWQPVVATAQCLRPARRLVVCPLPTVRNASCRAAEPKLLTPRLVAKNGHP